MLAEGDESLQQKLEKAKEASEKFNFYVKCIKYGYAVICGLMALIVAALIQSYTTQTIISQFDRYFYSFCDGYGTVLNDKLFEINDKIKGIEAKLKHFEELALRNLIWREAYAQKLKIYQKSIEYYTSICDHEHFLRQKCYEEQLKNIENWHELLIQQLLLPYVFVSVAILFTIIFCHKKLIKLAVKDREYRIFRKARKYLLCLSCFILAFWSLLCLQYFYVHPTLDDVPQFCGMQNLTIKFYTIDCHHHSYGCHSIPNLFVKIMPQKVYDFFHSHKSSHLLYFNYLIVFCCFFCYYELPLD